MATIFGKRKIKKWLPYVVTGNFFLNCQEYTAQIPCESKISCTVKEIEGNLCFAIFGKNSKWPPFLGRGKFFLKLPRVHFSDTLCVENLDEITLSRTVKEIEANLCFAIFGKNSKWPPFLGRGIFFFKLPRVHFSDTLCVENLDEITLSRTVKEIEANLCFAIFGKNSKWPPFLGRGKLFENCHEYIAQIPCGSKISTKSLYLAWLKR